MRYENDKRHELLLLTAAQDPDLLWSTSCA